MDDLMYDVDVWQRVQNRDRNPRDTSYESHRQRCETFLTRSQLPPLKHNKRVASQAAYDSTKTYGSVIFETFRFLSPTEFNEEMPKQIGMFAMEKARMEAEMAADEEEYDEELDDEYQEEWQYKLQGEVCFHLDCKMPYHQFDKNNNCIAVPVSKLDPVTSAWEIMCFNCALAELLDYRQMQETCSPPVMESFGQVLDSEHDYDKFGMQYELALLRIHQSPACMWSAASQTIVECAIRMAGFLQEDNGLVRDECHEQYTKLHKAIYKAVLYLTSNKNLARPMLLLGSPWFWDALDLLFVGDHKIGRYAGTAKDFKADRAVKMITKAWAEHTESLWDGPMRILRGSSSQKDVNLLQGLKRALSNNPPIELTGPQAELRQYWNEYMDTEMTTYWRNGPLSTFRNRYTTPPDVLPSNIALRLLEVVPGCLEKVFNPEFVSVEPEIDAWIVLADRYFEFLAISLYEYVDIMD